MPVRSTRTVVSFLAVSATFALGACGPMESASNDHTEVASPPVTVTSTAAASAPPTTTSDKTTTTSSPQPPTTTAPPALGGCSPEDFLEDAPFTEPVVLFCDGEWARAGQAQTDHVLIFSFTQDTWQTHPSDGESLLTGYQCYEEGILRASEAPEELIDQVLICDPEGEAAQISG